MNIFFGYFMLYAYAFSTKQQTFVCTNDSLIYTGDFKTNNQSQSSNIQKNGIFSHITTHKLNLSSYEQIQTGKIFNSPILILKLKESFEIQFIHIILELSEEEQPNSEILVQQKLKLQIPNCEQIVRIYLLHQFLFIACEKEQAFIFYLFNRDAIINETFSEAHFTQKVDKICNCQTEIAYDERNNIILISMQNCTNWVVFSFDHNGLNIIVEHPQFSNQILKSISIQFEIYLIFYHSVYSLAVQSKEATIIYENQEHQILYYYNYFSESNKNLIILNGSSNIQHELVGDTLITYETQIPKFISYEKNYLFLQFDKYLNLFSFIENRMYQANLRFNTIFNSYPYMYGFFGDTIEVYKIIKQQLNNLFVKFVNYDYQQLEQNLLFGQKYFVSIADAEQSFSIQNVLEISSVRPQFYIESNEVECNAKEDKAIQDCNIEKLTFLWVQYIYMSQKLFIVFQSKKQKLYIQDCESLNQIYLGQIEIISLKNVYIIHQYIILLHSDGKKVTIYFGETFPNIRVKCYQFNDKVEVIFSHKINLYFIFSSCDVQQLDRQSLFLLETIPFQTNLFQLQQQQCNKFTTYINRSLIKFNSNQLILITHNFIKKINFQNEEIQNIIIMEEYFSQFIMLIKKNEENSFIKYSIYEDKIIKHFNLPKYMYHYISPIKYQYNSKYLIVAASKDQIENRHYLLVYVMNNEKYNILVDIIENVDAQKFQLMKDNILLFFRQKQFYQRVLGKIEISCKILEPLIQFRKNIILQVLMKSKIFEYQQVKGEMLINLKNNIINLQQKNNSKLELEKQIKQQFLDPRYFVSGPINNINSQDYDISSPLKLISNKQNLQCSQIIKHICIDRENKIIKDYFQNIIFQKYIDIQTITVENDYVVIQKIVIDHKIIQIYSMRFEILFEIELEEIYSNFQVKIFSQYLFLIQPQKMLIYEIIQKLYLLQEINEHFGTCQITQLKQKENIFFIYDDYLPLKRIIYLEMLNRNVEIAFYKLIDMLRWLIHNISNSEDIQFIDSIYLIYSQNYELQILNSTHFLLAQEDLSNISIYEIQSYKVQPVCQNKTETTIIIQNSVSQIELKVQTHSLEIKIINLEIIYILAAIVIISALIFFLLKVKGFCKRHVKIEQKEIEIEI